MKLTLLQMTQSILSSLGSDEVNSISDTAESLQVADIIKQTYLNMLGRFDLPQHNQLFQLTASGDPTRPVLMTMPAGVNRVEWLKYFDTSPADSATFQIDQFGAYSIHDTNVDLQANANGWSTTSTTSNTIALGSVTFTVGSGLNINIGDSAFAVASSVGNYMVGTVSSYSGTTLILDITTVGGSGTYTSWTISQSGGVFGPVYKEVKILPVENFIELVNSFNPAEGDVGSFEFVLDENTTGSPMNFNFYYKNDLQPQYCCIIANQYVIFDSFDNTQDSTLQSAKTMAYGWVYPTFQMVDSFIPQIEDQAFSIFLNDAKALAFYELKRTPHQKAEQEVKRQEPALQKWKSIANRPGYMYETPNYGRRWSGRYWNIDKL